MKTTSELRNQVDQIVAELKTFLLVIEKNETTINQASDEISKALLTMAVNRHTAAGHLRKARQLLGRRKDPK